jgi:hypothetical protein
MVPRFSKSDSRMSKSPEDMQRTITREWCNFYQIYTCTFVMESPPPVISRIILYLCIIVAKNKCGGCYKISDAHTTNHFYCNASRSLS